MAGRRRSEGFGQKQKKESLRQKWRIRSWRENKEETNKEVEEDILGEKREDRERTNNFES